MNRARRAAVASSLACAAMLAAIRPASAEIDLTGEWANRFHEDAPHRGAGPEIGDYTGLPINDAGRLKAESWEASILSLPERQCIPHVVTYAMRGPAAFRMWKETEPVTGQIVSYRTYGTYGRPRTIWMDDRPHPPVYAPHTWTGFSTGRWDGDQLVVTTTHIKMGWIQRNGVATSDLTTMTERFIRHGDNLMVVTIIYDPVYLAEPFIRTSNWVANPFQQVNSFGTCGPAQIADEVPHPKGYVPHHLPGANDQLKEFQAAHGVPAEGALGGADTTYPEFAATLGQARQRRADKPATADAAALNRGVVDAGDIHTTHVQGNVYMLVGAGGNVTVDIGDDGVLLVDSGAAAFSDRVLAAIRKLSDAPIHYILNTSADGEHTGGNEVIARAGSRMATLMVTANLAGTGAAVIAHEKVLNAMSAPTGKQPATAFAAWPTDTYFTESKNVFFNDEAIQLLHPSSAHTDGDSIIFFRRSDVISTGDVFDFTRYPVVDSAKGGSFTGLIAAVNRIVDLAIPRDWQEGGTMIVPGHGRLADQADVVEYRDMLTIVRDRIQDMIKKGATLEQVKTARPTLDYDGRYGSTSGAWTTDMFVEAVYRDLAKNK